MDGNLKREGGGQVPMDFVIEPIHIKPSHMKRYIILIVLGLGFSTLFAQTETATRLYKEATADRSKTEQFLKQDFANIDGATDKPCGEGVRTLTQNCC